MGAAPVKSLRVRSVVASVVRVFRVSWRALLVLGLALFVPLGLLTTIAPGEGIEIERFDDPAAIATVAVGIVQVILPLLGTVLFAGLVAAAVERERGHEVRSLGEIVRSLPYGRLAAADVLLVVAIAIGLLLLIVPGVIALVWFCLIAPVIEHEDTTVRRAFGRSRELVRGHLRQVAVLVWPAVILQSLLDALIEALSFGLLGDGFGAEWLGAVLANLIADPVFALIVVTLYIELRGRERAGPATPVAAASGG